MKTFSRMRAWIGLALLAGAAGIAQADAPAPAATPETVVVLGTAEGTWNCNDVTAERARWLADKASSEGSFKRAGECYLAAGDLADADKAFLKASAQTGEETSRKLASNADVVKTQAKQLKQAFRRRS